jgi:hypothetical protein
VSHGAETGKVVAGNGTPSGVSTPANSIIYVNSKNCAAVRSCTTDWNVTQGNVLMVMFYDDSRDPGGDISDSQSNSYESFTFIGNYDASVALFGTTLTSGGALTLNSSGVHSRIVMAEFSGVSLTVDGSPAVSQTHQYGVCPNPSPLSVTTSGSDLLLSVLVESVTGGSTKFMSGSLAQGVESGSGAFQFVYQVAGTVGMYTQQFTFSPGITLGTNRVPWWRQAISSAPESAG